MSSQLCSNSLVVSTFYYEEVSFKEYIFKGACERKSDNEVIGCFSAKLPLLSSLHCWASGAVKINAIVYPLLECDNVTTQIRVPINYGHFMMYRNVACQRELYDLYNILPPYIKDMWILSLLLVCMRWLRIYSITECVF